MYDLSSHHAAGVTEVVAAAGASALYLPPSGPDRNPIENLWAKVKACLRPAAAQTRDALGEAVGRALEAVTSDDCRGLFRHCGYGAT